MTDHRSPPPPAEECLCRRYPSSQKGGTLVAELVLTLECHVRTLDGGGYRPQGGCPGCSTGALHVHDYRTRLLVGASAGIVTVVRYICAVCRATWQILPAFVARHLWRSWPTVEAATAPLPAAGTTPPRLPAGTRRRWSKRLSACAALLVVVLSTAETPATTEVAGAVGLEGTRRALVAEHARQTAAPVGQRLTALAALIHRLVPGVRLM